MKKAWLALLLTSLFTTALVGCSSKQEPAQDTPTKQTETPKQEEPKADQPVAPAPDASHEEVRSAFGLGPDYMDLPATAIPSLGLGQVEKLAIDQKQGLALAKAVSSALSTAGYEPQDSPPGIFVSTDGTKFAIGMKKKDGSFTLDSYELQSDGTYKNVKKEKK